MKLIIILYFISLASITRYSTQIKVDKDKKVTKKESQVIINPKGKFRQSDLPPPANVDTTPDLIKLSTSNVGDKSQGLWSVNGKFLTCDAKKEIVSERLWFLHNEQLKIEAVVGKTDTYTIKSVKFSTYFSINDVNEPNINETNGGPSSPPPASSSSPTNPPPASSSNSAPSSGSESTSSAVMKCVDTTISSVNEIKIIPFLEGYYMKSTKGYYVDFSGDRPKLSKELTGGCLIYPPFGLPTLNKDEKNNLPTPVCRNLDCSNAVFKFIKCNAYLTTDKTASETPTVLNITNYPDNQIVMNLSDKIISATPGKKFFPNNQEVVTYSLALPITLPSGNMLIKMKDKFIQCKDKQLSLTDHFNEFAVIKSELD